MRLRRRGSSSAAYTGIQRLQLPFAIAQKGGGHQEVIASVTCAADFPTGDEPHLTVSRLLQGWSGRAISSTDLFAMIDELRTATGARELLVSLEFTYFMRRTAPVSRGKSLLDERCEFTALAEGSGSHFIMGVSAPVLAVCPASRKSADRGAHNQRALLTARIWYDGSVVWIEDVAAILEEQASSPVYPLLKRRDEKYVTERAYENPRDGHAMVHGAASRLKEIAGVKGLAVSCEVHESIAGWDSTAYFFEGFPCFSLLTSCNPSRASLQPGSSFRAS